MAYTKFFLCQRHKSRLPLKYVLLNELGAAFISITSGSWQGLFFFLHLQLGITSHHNLHSAGTPTNSPSSVKRRPIDILQSNSFIPPPPSCLACLFCISSIWMLLCIMCRRRREKIKGCSGQPAAAAVISKEGIVVAFGAAPKRIRKCTLTEYRRSLKQYRMLLLDLFFVLVLSRV